MRRLPRLVTDGRIVMAIGYTPMACASARRSRLTGGDFARRRQRADRKRRACWRTARSRSATTARLTKLSQVIDSNVHEVEERAGVRTAPVQLGRNVWLGRASIVLPGVTIGDDTVIGSTSVVSESLPSHGIAAGVPNRPLRELSMRDDWRRR
jgi:hypothetical protein